MIYVDFYYSISTVERNAPDIKFNILI